MTVPVCRRCGQVEARFGWIGMEKHRIVHNHPKTVLDGCAACRRAGVLHPMRSIPQCVGAIGPTRSARRTRRRCFVSNKSFAGRLTKNFGHEDPCHQSKFVPHKLAFRSCRKAQANGG
ncbi:hypothetical protein XAP6164_2750002 [Xanthomonas phaseoli pv. phaseoli]|nr:hypothetical protein XAP6164_2750002 [Xanthomonas phaseoli pv. phaseoli]